MRQKGQSSVELTLVIAVALVLASPFIIASQSSVIQLNEVSGVLMLDDSLDDVEEAAKSLEEDSYPARSRIQFSTPRTVEAVYNPQFSRSSALIFQLSSQGNSYNKSVLFDFKLVLHNGGELTDEGNHEVVLKRNSEGINMSVIS